MDAARTRLTRTVISAAPGAIPEAVRPAGRVSLTAGWSPAEAQPSPRHLPAGRGPVHPRTSPDARLCGSDRRDTLVRWLTQCSTGTLAAALRGPQSSGPTPSSRCYPIPAPATCDLLPATANQESGASSTTSANASLMQNRNSPIEGDRMVRTDALALPGCQELPKAPGARCKALGVFNGMGDGPTSPVAPTGSRRAVERLDSHLRSNGIAAAMAGSVGMDGLGADGRWQVGCESNLCGRGGGRSEARDTACGVSLPRVTEVVSRERKGNF